MPPLIVGDQGYLLLPGRVGVEGDGGVKVLKASHKGLHHVLHLQLLQVLAAPGLDGGLVTPPLPHPLAVQDAGGEGGAENHVRERRQPGGVAPGLLRLEGRAGSLPEGLGGKRWRQAGLVCGSHHGSFNLGSLNLF